MRVLTLKIGDADRALLHAAAQAWNVSLSRLVREAALAAVRRRLVQKTAGARHTGAVREEGG